MRVAVLGVDHRVGAQLVGALPPWGPFARGNNAKLKAGEIVDAVTAADYPLPSTSRGTVPGSLSAAPRPDSDGLVMK